MTKKPAKPQPEHVSYLQTIDTLLQNSSDPDYSKQLCELKLAIQNDNTPVLDDIYLKLGEMCFAQENYPQAIEFMKQAEALRANHSDPLARILPVHYLGVAYIKNNQFDLALEKLLLAREVYLRENAIQNVNRIDNYIGMVYYWLGNYPKALETYIETLNRADKQEIVYVDLLVQIGSLYYQIGDYGKSLQYLQESTELREELHNGNGIATNYLNLGNTFVALSNSDKAQFYFTKALEIYRDTHDKDGMAKSLVNLGAVASRKNDDDTALDYYQQAICLAKELNDGYLDSSIKTNIAAIYSNRNDFEKALEYFQQSLIILQGLGLKSNIAQILKNIGNAYFKLGDYTNAQKYCHQSITLAQELDIKLLLQNNYQILSKVAEAENELSAALEYYKQYTDVKEQLVNEVTLKNISEIQTKYETTAREKEAEFLRQKNLELEEKNHLIEEQKDKLQDTLDKLQNSEIRYNFVTEELTKNIRTTLIGKSEATRNIIEMISVVAHSDKTNVLITGETGTGKEIVARNIHACSTRNKNHFYAVNCSAVPDTLFESQFFGHEKDAFTGANTAKIGWFEIADKSTLFLDEVCSLSPEQQSKLLRVLEERTIVRVGSHREIPIDVRIISAANCNLLDKVNDGQFRRDLYHRLAIFVINIPPLRERKEEIPLLLKHFVGLNSVSMNKTINKIEKSLITHLMEYDFPGNIRELRNMVERAVLLAGSSTLRLEHFLIPGLSTGSKVFPVIPAQAGIQFSENLTMQELEKQLLLKTLRSTGFNRVQTAKILDVNRKVIERKMKKYNITEEDQ